MRFVDLHAHCTFSTGDGYGPVRDHASRLVELERTHICFTDHGTVSAWVQLEKQALASELEPIFGIEAYVGIPGERRKTHMILLAMNQVGLQNINRIVTRSWQQFYQWPTVYFKDLVEFNEGIIALSGCADSALSCTLLGGKYFGDKTLESTDRNFQRALRGVRKFKEIFGDRYYLETQRFPGLERTCILNPLLAEISSATGVSLIATSDVHYPKPDENAIQRILHAAHRGGSVETADASWEYGILLTYPESDLEIYRDLKGTGLNKANAKAAVDNSTEIAQRCTGVRLPKANPPRYIQVNKVVDDPKALLRQWITDGWKYRIKHNQYMKEHVKEYKERIAHEFEIICARSGFADYFLIVADIVCWAKGQGIAVGPGRGSSAGSLVCYLLRITEIDSMQFPMLFERFLDPSRTDPPDIDVDFEDTRRDEIFDYAASKYGADRVGKIATFTRYKGKNSLDDIARVYHIPPWKIDAIKSKLIDRAEGHPRFSRTLEDTFDTFAEVRDIVSQTPELRYAARLEGGVRNFGIHAAAMAISSEPIYQFSAIYQRIDSDGNSVQSIAFDKFDAGYLGILKFDALSLITMGEIAQTCRLAKEITLEELYRIDLADNPTLEEFRKGNVLGVFQFEGQTTRRILKAVQPTKFQHLADVNALSRPGADDKAYVRNKNAGEWPKAAHPIIDSHLDWTYGVVVYEEQILFILRDLGGFEAAELNRMRKIIHDKLGSTAFNEYYQRFIKGCAAHGLSEDTAKGVWDGMVSASGYAFNIAHSVSYAHIGYWQQWLKIHYPAPSYTAKLTKCSDDARRAKLIGEAERHRISVEPPNLLVSQADWVNDGNTIYAGFSVIPGVGPKMCDKIIRWRDCLVEEDQLNLEWADLQEISGVGPKMIEKLEAFSEDPDPFGVHKVKRTLDQLRRQIKHGEMTGVPVPSHDSIDIPEDRQLVTYIGIVKKRKYYDAVEQLQKRSNEDLEYEQALSQLDDNHLLKYVAIDAEDEYGETVKVWINRWRYPQFARVVGELKVNRDVIVAQGNSSNFGGISIQAKQLVAINPYVIGE